MDIALAVFNSIDARKRDERKIVVESVVKYASPHLEFALMGRYDSRRTDNLYQNAINNLVYTSTEDRRLRGDVKAREERRLAPIEIEGGVASEFSRSVVVPAASIVGGCL